MRLTSRSEVVTSEGTPVAFVHVFVVSSLRAESAAKFFVVTERARPSWLLISAVNHLAFRSEGLTDRATPFRALTSFFVRLAGAESVAKFFCSRRA